MLLAIVIISIVFLAIVWASNKIEDLHDDDYDGLV